MRTKLSVLLLLITVTGAYSQTNQRIAKNPRVTYDWRPGFVSITELTGAPGLGRTSDELSKYYYGFTTVAGYQFSRNVKAGVGAGIHFHNEGTLFPLFLDARFNMNSQEIIPFMSAGGGVALDLDEIDATRVFINPAIGVRFVAARKTSIVFSAGLMVTTGGPDARKSFASFRLGAEFKGR